MKRNIGFKHSAINCWPHHRKAFPAAPVIEAEIERLEHAVSVVGRRRRSGDGLLRGRSRGEDLPDVGLVERSDLVQYDGNQFSLLFDGSDVGLSGADIDAVAIDQRKPDLAVVCQPNHDDGLGRSVSAM